MESDVEKQWFLKWVVGDWLKDPGVSLLKPATRGIWFDAICVMHILDRCGELQGSVPDLARVCRCTPNEMRAALDDLKSRNAADCDERNGVVTLQNRRMRREWTDRKSCHDRVLRHRRKKRGDAVTPVVTVGVTHIVRSKSNSHSPGSPPTGGARGRAAKLAEITRRHLDGNP